MNTLHIHHDCIISKLDELITMTQQLAEKPNDDCSSIMVTGIICRTIVILAVIAIVSWLIWKILEPLIKNRNDRKKWKREKDDADRKADAELKGKVLDYLKNESESYEKMLKDYDKKTEKNESEKQTIEKAISSIKGVIKDTSYLSQSSSCDIYDSLSSIKESLGKIEITSIDTEKTSPTIDTLKKDPYLIALLAFIRGEKLNENIDINSLFPIESE